MEEALIQTHAKPNIGTNGNTSQTYFKDVTSTPKGREDAEQLQQRLQSLARQAAELTAELENVRWLELGAKELSENGIDLYQELRRFEISMIIQALKFTHGSQKQAAELLRMNHTTLNSKIKKYNIDLRSTRIGI